MRWIPQDIRYGLRVLLRSPGFAAVTLLTLALGVGANTAIFSTLNALVLRKLPVRQPERLVELSGIYRNGATVPFSFPMFTELERGQRVFSALFGWNSRATFNVEANGTLFPTPVRAVGGSYYSELGATPFLGRLLAPEDVRRGAAFQTAVLSYEFWDRRYGRDPAAIGKTIRIEGRLFTITGVTRKWFTGMTPGESSEVTIPLTSTPFDLDSRALLWVSATGRLQDGVSLQQARARLQSLWPMVLAATVPTETPGRRRDSFLSMRLALEPVATGVNADLRERFVRPLYLLLSMAALILLIVCVNLASLALARAAARGHEISTRIALGARRWQLMRQMLTESILLSALGAALALALAHWGSQFLVGLMSKGTLAPVVLDAHPDWRVFGFTAIAAILTGLLIGLVPAWRMSRGEPAAVLRLGDRAVSRGTGTPGNALVITQVALSLILLQTAGHFLRTLESLRSADAGFQKAGVLQVSLYAGPAGYKGLDVPSYRRQTIARASSLPGVTSVASSNLPVPAGELGWRDTVSLLRAGARPGADVLTTMVVVSPDFFRTLGIPLLSGRDFDWADDAHRPRVAIADDNLARRLQPSGEVLQEHVRFGAQPEFEDVAIVGVAHSARIIDLRNGNMPVLYVPFLQYPDYSPGGKLLVRANHPAAVAKAVEDEIRQLGREYSTGVNTLEQASDATLLRERATATLSGFFATLALALAGVGLFGLMSYAVTRRTREIGIRMALGSRRGDILRMVLRETLLLTLAGVAIGLPCAVAATRLAAHVVFGPTPGDPVTLAAASATLLAVAAVAGLLPALRAMKMDPTVALRHE